MTTRMKNRKDQIRFIKNYIRYLESDSVYDLKRIIDENHFIEISVSRWAAKECLHYIYEHPEMDVIDAVDSFADKMNEYSTYNQVGSFEFSAAYDTAIFILDQLLEYTWDFDKLVGAKNE